MVSDTDYNKGGYAKYNIKREYLSEVRTRARDPKTGKVFRGEAGLQLKRRQMEKQAYYERNAK